MKSYYKLCNDFNKMSDYSALNIDKIFNFGDSVSHLAELANLQNLIEDKACSDAYDDIFAKFIEIVDSKDIEMELRIA